MLRNIFIEFVMETEENTEFDLRMSKAVRKYLFCIKICMITVIFSSKTEIKET